MKNEQENKFKDKWIEKDKKGLCAVEGFELVEKPHFNWWVALAGFVVAFLIFALLLVVVFEDKLPTDFSRRFVITTLVFSVIIGFAAGAASAKDNKTWEFERIADRKDVLKIIPDKMSDTGYVVKKVKE
jgi:hypothetical protein